MKLYQSSCLVLLLGLMLALSGCGPGLSCRLQTVCSSSAPHYGGILDVTFGTAGQTLIDLGGGTIINSLACQSDGKILASGYSGTDAAVARFSTEGVLDTSYGTAGSFTFNYPTSTSGYINASIIQPDDKIVVAGTDFGNMALARILTTGALDTTFGAGGKTVNLIGNGSAINAIDLQTDGKIVAAGWVDSGFEWDFTIFRFTTGGVLDVAFNGTGYHTFNLDPGDYDEANGIKVLSDGKFILSGNKPSTSEIIVTKVLSDGSALDTTFGVAGVATIGGAVYVASCLYVDSSGRIYVGGQKFPNTALVARLTPAGALDNSFGNSGIATFDVGGLYSSSTIKAIAVQQDGKLAVAGRTLYNASDLDILLARLTATGSLDPFFGTSGIVTNRLSSSTDAATSIFIQNSKIVIGGQGATPVKGILLRYTQ